MSYLFNFNNNTEFLSKIAKVTNLSKLEFQADQALYIEFTLDKRTVTFFKIVSFNVAQETVAKAMKKLCKFCFLKGIRTQFLQEKEPQPEEKAESDPG